MQNGLDLASITQKTPAQALVNQADFTIAGDISGTATEHGYIELVWKYPNNSQNGVFKCEANAIDSAGHGVKFSASHEVEISMPTLSDLVNHIRDLEIERESSRKKIEYLEQVEITGLKRKLNQEIVEKDAIKDRIDRLNHTESGLIHCGDSNSWHLESGHRQVDKHQTFKQPYSKIPYVHLEGIAYSDLVQEPTRFNPYIVSVDLNGFTLRCLTWAGTHIYGIGVSWSSKAQ
jgi:hypothetical protein